MEGNPGVGSLRDILAVLVGDADVVEADAVRPPRLVQLLVKGDEIDAGLAYIARDLTGIEPLGQIDHRAPAHAATGQLRDDLSQGSVQVSAHDVVIAANAMAELTGDVAVLLRPPGEAPHLSGGNRRQAERVLARAEPERDDAAVRTDAAPQAHRLLR